MYVTILNEVYFLLVIVLYVQCLTSYSLVQYQFHTRLLFSSATSSGNNSHFNSHLHQNHVRSHSLDRTSAEAAKSSLDSSFDRKSSERSLSPGNMPPADGCSQTSKSQTSQGQPSPPSSSDTRGEVEGSSDNNSPPTSVIQVMYHCRES